MASPVLPCTLIASPISPPRPNLFKTTPAQVPAQHSSSRFTVSCSGHNRKDAGPQLDRRDVLLGMGGLYGVTNLANSSPALAEPIPPVTLDKCSVAKEIGDGTPIDFNCCPPEGQPTDYVLPPVTKLRVRPALHLASPEYIEKFKRAIKAMKELSAKDPNDPRGFAQQSHVHCAYCNLAYPQSPGSEVPLQIHFCWHFFPWHRWYLYFYERICAKLIGDPTFALPFWNWDNPPGMNFPPIFLDEKSPLYNAKRNPDHFKLTPDLQYSGNTSTDPPKTIITNNLTEVYNEVVQNSKTLETFYGAKYSVGSKNEFEQGSIEGGSHTALHRWVGQNTQRGYDMGNFATAGNDLLFFCHHVNIDRLWNVWRDIRDKQKKPKDFPDRDWLDAKFVFYDENAKPVIVNVADSLDSNKMGFTWQKVDNPWLNSKPKALVKKSQFAKKTKAPKPKDTIFPVKLDKVLRILVDRPKQKRSAKEKDEEEELLLIEDIVVESSQFVRFEVFVNDEDVKPDELRSTAEYAGCYTQVPLTKSGQIKTKLRLDLDDLLEELDVEGDDQILVSIVPKSGGEFITIGGIKIVFAS